MHPGGIDLAAVRRQFIDRHAVPEGMIAAPILRSWQRCAAQGLDMAHPRDIAPMTASELRSQREKNEYLRRISRSELDMLGGESEIAGSVVILTDPSGLVLDMAGNVDFARDAMRVALRPGVVWAEAMTGTNAIGTAAVEGAAIAVRGAEHYFERHQTLTCSAAPIFDPAGKIVGLLDISGAANDGQGHALGLVKLAALEIEHRLFREGFESKTVVRFHTARSHLGTAREAVLVFDGEQIVAANRAALAVLGLTRGQVQNRQPRELFGRLAPGEAVQNLRGPGGIGLFARISAPRERPAPAPPPKRQPAPVQALPNPRGQAEPVIDAALRARIGEAARLLDADVPVLVMGETGTGKDVFARAAHAASRRADAPFVAINCAALPETLIEAELFGYEEGAFTGALRGGREGLLRQAAGGVLFLDEIGDMPLALQSRLLRVVQERSVTKLGAGRATPVDFALICATHRPLRALVDEGGFRADLFYRIAQYRVELPPLREAADLAGAIRHLWAGLAASSVKLSAEAEALLLRHAWPGNWRELVATLRAAIALAGPGGTVTPAMLPAELRESRPIAQAHPLSGTLDEITDATLRAALASEGGNVSRAARRLGVDRSTFYRRAIGR
jgi:sigma-54 dependent transcriptional regulator, acetoin dehydrogenase operon transcriptional activator AcoR